MWIFKEIWIFQRDPTLLDPLINLHEYISLELHVFTFKLLKIHLINEYKHINSLQLSTIWPSIKKFYTPGLKTLLG